MHKREEVFGNLSSEEITESLKACRLIDKEQYSIEERELFKRCRSLIESGKTYDEVAQSFEQDGYFHKAVEATQESTKSEKPAKKGKKTTIHLSDLLTLARQQTEKRVSLTDIAKILEICRLPEKEEYSPDERDRFVEACGLIKDMDNAESVQAESVRIEQEISTSAIASEDRLINLVEKVTDARARNVSGLVNTLYLQKVAQNLVQGQADLDAFYSGLEERILARIEGKSQIPLIMGAKTISLTGSSATPTQLVGELENTTSVESSSESPPTPEQ